MDFFAGSGTTGHAVWQLNSRDGGHRRFILVQFPEQLDIDKREQRDAAQFCRLNGKPTTIAELTKERLRRASLEIVRNSDKHTDLVETGLFAKSLARPSPASDTGFRVLKVDTSNMQDVYYRPDELTKDLLIKQVDHIKPDRTPEDLLFQVLLDWGVDLSLPIARETIEGKTVFFVDGNALAACFDLGVTETLVKQIAGRKPLRMVFRDDGFSSDAVKINVEQIFKLLSPDTEVRAL
jgi:adenine-specific DNA-methyltransferase